MAQHTILLSLNVSDREYIQIIQAQQKSGKYTVESYLRGILMETLDAPKPVAKKAKGTTAKNGKLKGVKTVTAAEVMAAMGSDADGAAGIATAESLPTS